MDQADRLRALMSGAERRARTLTVASGKGGVGKTNLAVNLALALSDAGKKVVLVDIDMGLANADVLLGLEPRLHLGNVLAGETSAVEALTASPGGPFLLAGSMGSRQFSDLEKSEREYLARSFRDLEAYADFILLDAAAGISRNVIHFAAAADEVVVVTTPEPTAIADGYAVLKATAREKGSGRIRIVVNLVRDEDEARRVHARMQAVARKYLEREVDYLGHVVADEHVCRSVRRKRPFLREFSQAPASACVRAIAAKLLGEEPSLPASGFIKRFASAIHGVLS